MTQHPLAAQAFGIDETGGTPYVLRQIQVDSSGNVIVSSSSDPALQVPTANDTGNSLMTEVVGNKTDNAVISVGTTASEMAYIKGILNTVTTGANSGERAVATTAAVISTGLALFNVANGPVEILDLISICQTANNSTASTLQYESLGTLGSTTQTISGASASLASATAGTSVVLQGTALSTAPLVSANGANIAAGPARVFVPAGTINAVVGVGSTTGTWQHYLRYRPLAPGATVTAAF